MSDRPHEQLCQALEALLGWLHPSTLTTEQLLHEATWRWRTAATAEARERPRRDRIIQLAHQHGLDTNTITKAIGGLPDGRQLLAHATVQHLTKQPTRLSPEETAERQIASEAFLKQPTLTDPEHTTRKSQP